MGNSNGTLAEYWDAIESTPGLQGGFIWEFWDHGLVQTPARRPDALGLRRRLRRPAQRRQLRVRRDGLAGPTARSPRCGSTSASPPRSAIGGSPSDLAGGRVEIANHQHFTDLGWLRARYSLTMDGVEVAGGAVRPAGPGSGRAGGGRPARLGDARWRDRRGLPDRDRDHGRRDGMGSGRLRGVRPPAPGLGRDPGAERRRQHGRPPGDRDRRGRRRRPPRPSAPGRVAGALAVARPDRQRPDRRDGRALARVGRGQPRTPAGDRRAGRRDDHGP